MVISHVCCSIYLTYSFNTVLYHVSSKPRRIKKPLKEDLTSFYCNRISNFWFLIRCISYLYFELLKENVTVQQKSQKTFEWKMSLINQQSQKKLQYREIERKVVKV